MTGQEFKDWADKYEPTELAVALGITPPTLYGKFKLRTIDTLTLRALAQLGCKQAKTELARPFRLKERERAISAH